MSGDVFGCPNMGGGSVLLAFSGIGIRDDAKHPNTRRIVPRVSRVEVEKLCSKLGAPWGQ